MAADSRQSNLMYGYNSPAEDTLIAPLLRVAALPVSAWPSEPVPAQRARCYSTPREDAYEARPQNPCGRQRTQAVSGARRWGVPPDSDPHPSSPVRREVGGRADRR